MQKVLITGGSGFIAKSLTEMLCSDFEIISLNREILDLTDSKKVSTCIKQGHFDVVIHTATYDAAPSFSTKDPEKVLKNNLQMFFNLVRLRDYFGKMIYFGSGAEFGNAHWKPKMKEGYFDTHVPSDPYGFSKYIMSKYTRASDNIYNLRLFGVFGKYDDWRYRLIPNACCQAVCDMPIRINKNAVYDFLFIDDLAKIVKWFMNHTPKYSVYNVCSGKTNEFLALAELIVEISGKHLPVVLKSPGCGREYSGDNSRLMAELSPFQFTPIRKSIEGLYHWYEQSRHVIDNSQFAIS